MRPIIQTRLLVVQKLLKNIVLCRNIKWLRDGVSSGLRFSGTASCPGSSRASTPCRATSAGWQGDRSNRVDGRDEPGHDDESSQTQTTLARARFGLAVEALALALETDAGVFTFANDPDHIKPVVVIFPPDRHDGGIAAMRLDEIARQRVDQLMLPGNENEGGAVIRLVERAGEAVDIAEAEARVDRQAEGDRRRLNRRERADVIIGDAGIVLALGRIGRERDRKSVV